MSTTTFQIGCMAEPLEVQWGPSHWDKGEKARSIKVFLDDEHLKTKIDQLDHTLCKFDDNGRTVLRIKIWQSARVAEHSTGKKLKVDDIHRGDRIIVIVKPYHWNYEGSRGVSLTCSDVLVMSRASSDISQTPKWS
jgi:hypothetical protein